MRNLCTVTRFSRLTLPGVLLVVGIVTTPLPGVFAATGLALTVDAGAGRHAISPDIYGMNSYTIDAAFARELHIPVQRWGGDATSRYNWRLDSSNSGGDWYFMGGNGQAMPVAGKSADDFVRTNISDSSKSLLTVPIIPYVNGLSTTNCSYPVSVYGAQQATNPYDSDCGNGLTPTGTHITDTHITANNTANTADLQAQWVQHLTATHGTAAGGGVAIYELDNEPSGWGNTHRDIHPGPTGYDELVNASTTYAAAIKGADPSAAVDGPGDFGWPAYIGTANNKPGDNRDTHGGTEFAAYYLRQMHTYAQTHGIRPLDYFDEHYYPAAAAVPLSPAGNADTQASRLRSTRSLWDPTYVDESWIGQSYPPIQMIPRMHDWVNAEYPGTKTAITEYNWGGLEDINGALAEADVLGIFGREGLDLATMWGPPTTDQPGAYAFRLYRNYDGAGGQFGDTAVTATSSDQGQLAVYAAIRGSDGALTLVVLNKTGGDLPSALALNTFAPTGSAQVYRYSAANLHAITRQPDQPTTASGFTTTYPANSLTLVVVPPIATAHTNVTPIPAPVPGHPTAPPTQATPHPWTNRRPDVIATPASTTIAPQPMRH